MSYNKRFLSSAICLLDACILKDPRRTQNRSLFCAAGFVYKKNKKAYFVTSLNVVIGREISSGEFKNLNLYVPDTLLTKVSTYDFDFKQINRRDTSLTLDLYNDENIPNWYIHPKYGRTVDLAVFDLNMDVEKVVAINDVEECEISSTKNVAVVGYPLYPLAGEDTSNPVFKNAMVSKNKSLYFFIDGVDRKGMYGSPVFSFFDSEMDVESSFSFIGVYAGKSKLSTFKEVVIDTVWKRKLIDEIIDGALKDTSYE